MSASQIKSRGLAVESRKPSRRKCRKRHRLLPLAARLKNIRLFLCDVDGVLTDASVFVGGAREIKQFNIQDGLGLMLLRRAGIKAGWISSRPSRATARRAAELRIDFLLQGGAGKVAAIESILAQTGLSWSEIGYVGDDLFDLGALKRAGVAVAPSNGVAEAKALADYVTRAAGGHGAVREAAELILKAQKKWDRLVSGCAA